METATDPGGPLEIVVTAAQHRGIDTPSCQPHPAGGIRHGERPPCMSRVARGRHPASFDAQRLRRCSPWLQLLLRLFVADSLGPQGAVAYGKGSCTAMFVRGP